MKNTLNGSVKSGMLKAAMVLMMMSASAELAGTLNAQGKGKAQTEKTTENMTAADFWKTLGISFTGKDLEYATKVINMMPKEEKEFAKNRIKQELQKVAEKDKIGYVVLLLDAIQYLHTGKEASDATDTYGDIFDKQADNIDIFSKIYYADRIKISNEIATKNNEAATQNAKENEELLQKIYETDPQNPKLKQRAKEAKQVFEQTGYKYTPKTAQLFATLGIK